MRLVRVGRAQVELEAVAGRAGLEGDAQLELARHADPVGGHDREPREQRGVEEPHARAGPALLLNTEELRDNIILNAIC